MMIYSLFFAILATVFVVDGWKVTPRAVTRRSLLSTVPAAVFLSPAIASAASSAPPEKLVDTLRENSNALKELVSLGEEKFISGASRDDEDPDAPGSTLKLPQQIPLITFQKLAPFAHTAKFENGMLDPEDYLYVVADYAEAAGAARDLYRLSKLGRRGEGGGEDVARGYAKRCWSEVEKASPLIEALLGGVS